MGKVTSPTRYLLLSKAMLKQGGWKFGDECGGGFGCRISRCSGGAGGVASSAGWRWGRCEGLGKVDTRQAPGLSLSGGNDSDSAHVDDV